MPHQPASEALSHIRVLDLTRVRAGPTAVRQLGDWGADVIKVEPPEVIDPEGSLGGGRKSSDFQNLQRNKRSVTLNLKESDGLALFMRLVATADVVVENYRPDVKERLGIAYEALAAVNPRIILASISGFGQTGPYAKRPGFDQVAQGMGGLMSITGEPGHGPMRAGVAVADLSAGLFAALGILTALVEREKSGQGQWLHTSLLQSQIFMLDFQAVRWLMNGVVPPQAGNDHPTSIPTGLFRTADGHINVAVAGQTIWNRFCAAIERTEWAEDPRFLTGADRSKNRADLRLLIEALVKEHPNQYWIDHLTEAGVPCGPVYGIDELFDDPQVRHLGVAAEMDTLPFGPTHCLGQPVALERTPSSVAVRPPERGEHTDEILGELGLDAGEIDNMRARDII
jgi:formyl-CoA transferase